MEERPFMAAQESISLAGFSPALKGVISEPAAVQRMKAATRDLATGGPTLAALAFKAGLIDVCNLFIAPIIVGGMVIVPSRARIHAPGKQSTDVGENLWA